MRGYSADLLRLVEETASPSCSSQVRRKAGARPFPAFLPRKGPIEPAVSLPSQCLPRAGAPATDLTPYASTWFI